MKMGPECSLGGAEVAPDVGADRLVCGGREQQRKVAGSVKTEP
jgi:hypothetical protein